MVTLTVIENEKEICSFVVTHGASLLAQIEQQGIKMPGSCRRGTCGMCMQRVTSGLALLQPIRARHSTETMVLLCDVTLRSDVNEGEITVVKK